MHLIQSEKQAIEISQAFADQCASGAAQRDRERSLPHAEIAAFSEKGLWAITVPQSHGGLDISSRGLLEVIATVSEADPAIGQIPQNHFAHLEKIRLHGTSEQKDFFFDQVLNGARLGNAAAEPGDLPTKEHATRLHDTDGQLQLTGRKIYATGALFSHWIPVPAVDPNGQAVVVQVPRHAKGVHITDDWDGFGQRTTASGSVRFEGVVIDPLWIIRSDPGIIDSMNVLSQLVHVGIDLGIARGVLREGIDFLKTQAHSARGSVTRTAADDPLTLSDVGRIALQVHAAQAISERAADWVDAVRRTPSDATHEQAILAVAEARILTTEAALTTTNQIFDWCGTQSTRGKYALDRHWRNARTHTLHDNIRWKYHKMQKFATHGP